MPHSVFELRFGLEVSIFMPFEEISMGLSVPIVLSAATEPVRALILIRPLKAPLLLSCKRFPQTHLPCCKRFP